MKIAVNPPDVNVGDVGFTVNDGVIQFGLTAIKGVGEKAIEALVAERRESGRYRDLFDVCERLDPKLLGKSAIEAMVKSGAFHSMGQKRSVLFAAVPAAMQAAVATRKAKEEGQGMLFDGDSLEPPPPPKMLDVEEWNDQLKLQFEKEVLGIYLSSHPLAEKDKTLRIFRTHRLDEVAALPGRTEVTLGGMISAVRQQVHRAGKYQNQKYVRFTFEDLTKSMSAVMFAESYSQFADKVKDDRICFIKAEVDHSREEPGLIVNEIIDLEFAPKALAGQLNLRVEEGRHAESTIESIRRVLRSHPGDSQVKLHVIGVDGWRAVMEVGREYRVACTDELTEQLTQTLGAENVRIVAPPKPPRQRPSGGGRFTGAGYGGGGDRRA
jgi:DNA polymerase-3 subunit alpha